MNSSDESEFDLCALATSSDVSDDETQVEETNPSSLEESQNVEAKAASSVSIAMSLSFADRMRDLSVTFSALITLGGSMIVPMERLVRSYLIGSLYVIGGRDGGNCTLSSVIRFDCGVGRWESSCPPLGNLARSAGVWTQSFGRYNHAATLHNGSIYVVGGIDMGRDYLSSGERWDGSSLRWTSIAPMQCPRFSPTLTSLGAYGLFAVGGVGESRKFLSSVERYCEADNRWMRMPSMSAQRHGHTTVVYQGSLYVLGGNQNGSSVERLDLDGAEAEKWVPMPPMVTPRRGHVATVVGRYLYVIGGQDDTAVVSSDTDTSGCIALVERFDGVRWSSMQPMSEGRSEHTAVVHEYWIYVFGGIGEKRGEILATAEKYDSSTGEWSGLPPMGHPRWGHTTVAVGDCLYVVGGKGCHGALSSVECFDTVKCQWVKDIPSMPEERLFHKVIAT